MISRISSMTKEFRRCCSALLVRYTEPPVIRFVAVSFIVLSLFNLLIACWTSKGGQTIYGSWLGGDYSAFYTAGAILNDFSSDRLYDFSLQSKLLHSLLPGIPASEELPFINPPFFALLFKPLSLLPFMPSYLSWILVSIGLYLSGFLLIRKTLRAIPLSVHAISFLLAVSFEPFLMETAFGGNTSAFGFFVIALAIYFERTGNLLASGISFSLCLYKPTLLFLIIPMLILSRRFRILAGFLGGSAVLAGTSFLLVGKQPCMDYLNILFGAAHKSLGTEVIFRTFKYVDIFSFFRLLYGNAGTWYWVSIISAALASLPFLVRLWWKFNGLDNDRRDLVFACTLSWTAVLSLHFGIYDTVIVVFAVLLTANVLYQNSGQQDAVLPPGFRSLVILLYLTPWMSQHAAMLIRTQIFTLALAATGAYQLILAMRIDSRAAEEIGQETRLGEIRL